MVHRFSYLYENTTSRLRQVIDEKQQVTFYTYNPRQLHSSPSPMAILRSRRQTSASLTIRITARVTSMTDGIGTTTYDYLPDYRRLRFWAREDWPAWTAR